MVATPPFDQDLSRAHCGEHLAVEQLIYYPAGDCGAICREGRKRALKLSQLPFSQGESGAMNAVFAPTAPIRARIIPLTGRPCVQRREGAPPS